MNGLRHAYPVHTLHNHDRKTLMFLEDGLHFVDCLHGMTQMPDASVDLVFADLPYGRTQNNWDNPLPLIDFWKQISRVCKRRAALVFTAMQPFTSLLVVSNLDWFRYEIIWKKNKVRGFLNANRQPLRIHENVLVFYREQPEYRPQMTTGHTAVHSYTKHTSDGSNYGKTKCGISGGGATTRYPTSILEIAVVNNDSVDRIHPTQKPVDLPAWFIKTYTLPGQLVLDPTAGSGSTLIAAQQLNRRYIGFENDEMSFKKATDALKTAQRASTG